MKLLLMIVTVIVIFIAAIGNPERVSVRFLSSGFDSPLIWLMLSPLLLGLLLGWLVSPASFRRNRQTSTVNTEKTEELEAKMHHWDQVRAGTAPPANLTIQRHPNYTKYEVLKDAVAATIILNRTIADRLYHLSG